MNVDPNAELNSIAANLQSEWLALVQDTVPNVIQIDSQAGRNQVTVIRVPDLGADADSLDVAGPVPGSDELSVGTSMKSSGGASATEGQITAEAEQQIDAIPMASEIVSDIHERPGDWSGNFDEKDKTERTSTQASSDRLIPDNAAESGIRNVDSKAISDLTDQILDRFPLASPTLLLFAGSEWNAHIDETCAQVAYQLASRDIGRILLIDSESEESALTKASGTSSYPGLSCLLRGNKKWDACVVDHEACNMDFLPIGEEPLRYCKRATERAQPLIANLKTKYQFICVSAGDAHSNPAGLWAADADGSYLVVSMTNSSQMVAKSAVEHLQSLGARMLGCIVTNAV